MEKESIFLTYIRATLKKWVGFQVAIDEGMGGAYAQEKEMWLGSEIENYFKSYKDVKPDELEDYVGTMIENEFDTYFEDGSILEICKLFCRAYSLSEVDPNAPMFQVLKSVPAPSSRVSNSSLQTEEASTTDNVTTTIDNLTTRTDNVTTHMNGLEIKDSEDDGWTVVNKKHRK